MKQTTVTMVRIYCSEKDRQHRDVIDLLHREHLVAGVTAFRGIAGFGRSGQLHEAGLLDVSLDLPIVAGRGAHRSDLVPCGLLPVAQALTREPGPI